MKILISGGAGFVGTKLTKVLLSNGYEVNILTRSFKLTNLKSYFYWNPDKYQIDQKAFDGVDGIIHLAGAGIADKRWTKKRKKILYSSRIDTTKFLYEKSMEFKLDLIFFISSSASGWYGSIISDQVYKEQMPAYPDFLGNLCSDWELAADLFNQSSCKVSKLRLGIVLSKDGGALPMISMPIKYGFGSSLGSGMQYVPWIHISDLCQIFLQIIQGNLPHGIYNAVAPEYVTNKDFTFFIAKTLNRHIWFPPIPEFILRLLFGEMSEILLKGSKISSEKLKEFNFAFKYPKLNTALHSILK